MGTLTRRALLGALIAATAATGSNAYKPRLAGIRGTGAALPAVPGSPEIAPTSNPRIGMNLSAVYNYEPARPYTNLLRYRQPQNNVSAPFDKSKVDNTTGEFTIDYDTCYTFIHPPTVPNARVVVRWTGTGDITVGLNSANNIVSGTEGPYKTLAFDTISGTDTYLNLAQGKYGKFDCREPDRPLTQKWELDFILSMNQWSISRFMDWQNTNSTSNIAFTATNRPLPIHPFDIGNWGQSIEDCIDLCRVSNNSAWICVPYNFDQSYVELLVATGHANLRPNTQLFIEYCNEDWNSQFEQYHKLNDAWVASNSNLGEPGNTYAQQAANHIKIGNWVSAKASQIGASLGVNNRICRTLGIQTGGGSNLDFLLQRPNLIPTVDAVALAPYFAPNYLELTPEQLTNVPLLWERATIDPSSGVDAVVSKAAAVQAQLASYGLPMIGYEGSSHFVTSNLAVSQQYHYDPFYTKLYAYYLRELMFGLPNFRICLFLNIGVISVFGPWGTQASLTDNSPRIQALRNAAAGIYIVPDLTIQSSKAPAPATQGDSYSFIPVAMWGKGPRFPRVWQSVGDPLPPGMSLTNTATGEVSGKGTAQGTYPIRLRVTDGNGSDERSFTIPVGAPESYTYIDDARQVGNLPGTGPTASRTSARGWSQDVGYASNGAVLYDGYPSGSNLFGAGINSKNRKVLWDFDSTTWTAQFDNAILDIVADEGSGKSLTIGYNANSGNLAIGKNGAFAYNVGPITRGPHVIIPSLIDGKIYLSVDGNVFGIAAGYDVGQDYAATQRIGYRPGVDPVPYATKPVYNRIGLKAL